MNHPPITIVRWLDTGLAISEGWKDADYYRSQAQLTRMEVVTAGVLVHEDEKVIVLANSYDATHENFINAQVVAKAGVISRHDHPLTSLTPETPT